MLYPEFPIVGFIAAALLLFTLPRQIRVRNIPTITLILWSFQHCVSASVNAIIWAGNVDDSVPVWCHITVRLKSATIVALPAATVCICKHLEFIASRRPASSVSPQLHRKIFDSVMCIGIPCLWMIIYYCFQDYRYFIAEDFGCYPSVYGSLVTVVILYVPTLLLSVVTLIYGSIAVYHLTVNRIANHRILASHIKSRDAALSSGQYYRLMTVTMIFGVWGVVWITIEIQRNLYGLVPLPSWRVIHEQNSQVLQLSTAELGPQIISQVFRLLWWPIPTGSYVLFLFMGTSREALSEYKKFWVWFRTKVLKQTLQNKSTLSTFQCSAPTYATPVCLDTTKDLGTKVDHELELSFITDSRSTKDPEVTV